MRTVVPKDSGTSFEIDSDTARIIVSGAETLGAYSLLEWTVAESQTTADSKDYGAHRHNTIEETFLILEGHLEFLLGEEILQLNEGDFVRVPKGTKHGYQNVSGSPTRMLVTFLPGGFEQLFLRYQNDDEGFLREASSEYDSEYGLPSL